MVELKERLDEEENISWERDMESEGVKVVLGLIELKKNEKM